jgi:hypothetical protein
MSKPAAAAAGAGAAVSADTKAEKEKDADAPVLMVHTNSFGNSYHQLPRKDLERWTTGWTKDYQWNKEGQEARGRLFEELKDVRAEQVHSMTFSRTVFIQLLKGPLK